jgi:N-acyl-D-aspartate/D-glutamate deacylase
MSDFDLVVRGATVVGVEASIVNGVVATREGGSTGARTGRFPRAG